MKIRDLTLFLEKIAPLQYQESYDNAGLIVGDFEAEIRGIIVCLDSLEAVIDEAIETGCNVVVAHHPIVFKGLKKLNGLNYVERTVIKAVQNNIALYAIHTNLDNVLKHGVSTKIAKKLGLSDLKILAPKRQLLMKLTVFVPKTHVQQLIDALHTAGAGSLGNYQNCSFRTEGIGRFRPLEGANPFLGTLDSDEEVVENRVEVVFSQVLEKAVLAAMRAAHPYEEVAFFLNTLENEHSEVGSGIIGFLPEPLDSQEFLYFLKEKMQTACVRHTQLLPSKVHKIAVCGGAGSFLLPKALSAKADVFVTGDYKYHEFFDADGKILIADIGHYESEQFTQSLLHGLIKENFSDVRVFSTKIDTNPIKYL
jgi:dinuclear metal center YbgI/SA1388 family protein